MGIFLEEVMASSDFKFSGAYGGKKKKEKKSEKDFTQANKDSAERNKNLSDREQKDIAAARLRNQARRKKHYQKKGN